MRKRLGSAFMAMVFITTMVGAAMAADTPKGRWWRNSKVMKLLKLTGGEIEALDAAYTASRRRMIAHKSRVETEQLELQTLVEQRNSDDSAIRKQHRKLEKARSDLAAEQFGFVVECRKIIGHDRFQKLVDMQREAKKRRRNQ